MQTLEVILERNDGFYWARIEGKGDYSPNNGAESRTEAIEGLRAVIADYKKHEGINDKYWNKIDEQHIVFDIRSDLQAFFEEYSYLSISATAKRIGLNPSLLRQYARGLKHPSEAQAQKIQDAIRSLGKDLSAVSIYA